MKKDSEYLREDLECFEARLSEQWNGKSRDLLQCIVNNIPVYLGIDPETYFAKIGFLVSESRFTNKKPKEFIEKLIECFDTL